MSQWALADYRCEEHGDFEQLVERPVPDELPCPVCAASSAWVIGAPKLKILSVPCYATIQGGDMKERPPGMLDTRPLAEGMPMAEWKKKQDDARVERRHHDLIKRGLKPKKIQVG